MVSTLTYAPARYLLYVSMSVLQMSFLCPAYRGAAVCEREERAEEGEIEGVERMDEVVILSVNGFGSDDGDVRWCACRS